MGPCLHSQFASSGCCLINVIYQAPCPQVPVLSLYLSLPAIVPVLLSHPVTIFLNSKGLGSLTKDLPARSKNQEGSLVSPIFS